MSDYETSNDVASSIGDEYDVVRAFTDAPEPAYDAAGYDDEGYDDDLAYDDSEAFDAAVDAAVESELVAMMSGNEADAYWAQRQAENQERAAFEHEQQLAAVRPQLDGLIEQAGQKHGVVESARNGRLEQFANEILDRAQYEARAGRMSAEDQAFLSSPQVVPNTLALAAELLRIRAVTDRGLAIIEGSRGWEV